MGENQERAVVPGIKTVFDKINLAQPGLLCWRVKKLDMELVPEKSFQQGLYSGDCYLFLEMKPRASQGKGFQGRHQHQDRGDANIHIVIGSKCSEDEKFIAAMQAVEIDEQYFNGAAKQIRQEEGHETSEFCGCFRGTLLCWRPGGYDSALKKVESNTTPVLYKIKGKIKCRATEVDVAASELINNADDCFVLDAGKGPSIFVIKAKSFDSKTNMREVIAARNFAERIRCNEKGGKAMIHVLEMDELNSNMEDSCVKEIRRILNTRSYLSFRKSSVRDDEHEAALKRDTKLYRVSDGGSDQVKAEEIPGPLRQCQLDEKDCFILDARNIYVWIGKKSTKLERRNAPRIAEEFKKKKNLPKYLSVVVVKQHAEPAEFRSCFVDWKSGDESTGKVFTQNRIAKSIEKGTSAKKFHETSYLSRRRHTVVDDFADDNGGNRNIRILRVDRAPRTSEYSLVACKPEKHGIFYSGDCYIVDYPLSNPTSTFKAVIYFWQGNDCDTIERGAVAKLTVDIDDQKYHGAALQVRVMEGKEPPHFLRCFNGHLTVFQGNETDPKVAKQRMFQVHGKNEKEARVIEVPVDASNLNSNDTFIVTKESPSGGHIWTAIWTGKGSCCPEKETAKEALKRIYGEKEYELFQEGKEKEHFWIALGGKKEYANYINLQNPEFEEREARLFHCYNKRGKLEVDEIVDFTQDDLVEDDVMFIDDYYDILVWIGKDADKEKEAVETNRFVLDYVDADPSPRTSKSVNVINMKQGSESLRFKSYFPGWEDHRAAQPTFQEFKHSVLESNKLVDLSRQSSSGARYSYEQLRGKLAEDLPDGVDPFCKEEYLEDEEFESVFSMSKDEFRCLKGWQRQNLKKNKEMF